MLNNPPKPLHEPNMDIKPTHLLSFHYVPPTQAARQWCPSAQDRELNCSWNIQQQTDVLITHSSRPNKTQGLHPSATILHSIHYVSPICMLPQQVCSQASQFSAITFCPVSFRIAVLCPLRSVPTTEPYSKSLRCSAGVARLDLTIWG